VTDTQRLQKNIKALVGKPAPAKTLAARDAAAPLPTAVGAAKPKLAGSQASGTGGSIASPLTEPDSSAREYHPAVNLSSTDGLFTIVVRPIKKVVMQDANTRPVTIEYDTP